MIQSVIDTAQKVWSSLWSSWQTPNDVSVFLIQPFRDNEHGVNYRDAFLRNISSIKGDIRFLIAGHAKDIKMYAIVPEPSKTFFMNMMYAAYPTSELHLLPKLPHHHIQEGLNGKDLVLRTKADYTKDGTYIDPLKDIFSIFSTVKGEEHVSIMFTMNFKPEISFWSKVWAWLKKSRSSKKKSADDKEGSNDDITTPEVFVKISYGVVGSPAIVNNITSTFSGFIESWKTQRKPQASYIALTRDQAVNFFHIPTKDYSLSGLDYAAFRKLPYPLNIPTPHNTPYKELTILGKTNYRDDRIPFGIKEEDKFRHMYILGKTWTGKSTFLSNILKSDMESWSWLALLDPHGDLVMDALMHVPEHRREDVILFDIADEDFPIGFNLLEYRSENEKNRIVSGVVSVFHKLFAHSRWPRLEYILRNVVISLVEYPHATLTHLMRVLTDKEFREEVLSYVTDPIILKFWRGEFDQRQDRQVQEAIWPIANKIGQFLSSRIVRNIFGQSDSKLNIRECMDSGKIVLINLSKWIIGEDNANMIGSFLVTKFQIDAMGRADTAKDQRRPFYLFIDEFQNFATDSFAVILSEARKYKLALVMANQYTSQLSDDIRNAIFGNVGTIVSFTVWYDDAKVLSSQFREVVTTNDLISLPRFTTYTRMMVDGITWDAFSTTTMPLPTPIGSEETIASIRERSRSIYATPKDIVEKQQSDRQQQKFSKQERIARQAQLEWQWMTSQEAKNSQHPFVKAHTHLFDQYKINGEMPDSILFDVQEHKHIALWYQAPSNINDAAVLTFAKGETITTINDKAIYGDASLYTHKVFSDIRIMIGPKHAVQELCAKLHPDSQRYLFVPRPPQIWSQPRQPQPRQQGWSQQRSPQRTTQRSDQRPGHKPMQQPQQRAPQQARSWTPQHRQQSSHPRPTHSTSSWHPSQPWSMFAPNTGWFSINDIKLGESYEWYVKLIYNYGVFVTVKWVEWLLHKNVITQHDWKQQRDIGDTISVIASEFKEIKGEKKVVWKQ